MPTTPTTDLSALVDRLDADVGELLDLKGSFERALAERGDDTHAAVKAAWEPYTAAVRAYLSARDALKVACVDVVAETLVRERMRTAFHDGACWAYLRYDELHADSPAQYHDRIDIAARSRYPDPKPRTRPREIEAGGLWYRVVDGRLQHRGDRHDKTWYSAYSVTASHIPAIADLLAHPDEPVPEGE